MANLYLFTVLVCLASLQKFSVHAEDPVLGGCASAHLRLFGASDAQSLRLEEMMVDFSQSTHFNIDFLSNTTSTVEAATAVFTTIKQDACQRAITPHQFLSCLRNDEDQPDFCKDHRPCLNGGQCAYESKSETFACKCRAYFGGEDCGVNKCDTIIRGLKEQVSRLPPVTDCSSLKASAPLTPSGVYTIRPDERPAFDVYCDMSESVAWTKILQIKDLYDVNTGAFGNIAVGRSFAAAAKLSDDNINAIRQRLASISSDSSRVFYRVTASDSVYQVYAKIDGSKRFNDTRAGWNVFPGQRQQCTQASLADCQEGFISTDHHTLDTLHDTTHAHDSANRFFVDHDGPGTTRRCWVPNTSRRCVSKGYSTYTAHSDVELWIGKL